MRFLIHILFILLLLGNSLGLSTASGQCLDNLRRYHFKSVEVKKLSVGDSLPVICRQGDSMSFPSDYVASDRAIAVFAQAPKSKYAFDVYNTKYAESLLFSEKYEELRTNGSEAYQVPFKLIPVGATDVVQVTITPAELTEGLEMKAINPDKIIFRTATGAEYKPKPVSDDKGRVTMELTLPAAKENDGYELYALHPVYAANTNGYEYDMLGKLTVVSYTMEKPKVVLVAVNGNTIDESAVKTYLDKVYLPVGVNWQVGKTVEFVYDIPKDSLDVTGSGLFSQYTPAMKRMNAAFMQRDDYDASTLYIFVLQRASLDNTSGDMPRGCQFGYIFTGAITDAARSGMSKNEIIGRTIAHELGHGMFKLKHTFDSEYRIAQSTTDNLMDYNWGTDYVKHQWDAIHAPGLVIGLFERDEDGMMMAGQEVKIQDLLDWIKSQNKNKVKFADNQFLIYKTIGEKALKANINTKEIWLYAELFGNGIINLTNPDVRFVINNSFHSSFYLSFQYVDKEKEALKIWTYSYENFKELMKYLNYEITPPIKSSIIEQYKQYIQDGKKNCNKMDVVFETIPDFALPELSNEDKYESLTSLSNCTVVNGPATWIWGKKFDTNEQLAIINLLKGIDVQYFVDKYTQLPGLINTLYNKLGDSGRNILVETLSLAGLGYWNNEQIIKAPYFLFTPMEIYDDAEKKIGAHNTIDGFCDYDIAKKQYNVYLINRQFSSNIPLPDKSDKNAGQLIDTFEPTRTKINDVELFIPAYFAKTLSDSKVEGYRTQWANLAFSTTLIELNLAKLRLIPKSKVVINQSLLSDLNNLRNSNIDIGIFVRNNIHRLIGNEETIWAMNSFAARGRVWEHYRALNDLEGWRFIGGQSQKLLDFFYNKTGIIMQQKSIGADVVESTIKGYASSYKTIINDLADVRMSGSYTLQGGETLIVNGARLDIVVPKSLDISYLRSELVSYAEVLGVKVEFVIK